MRRVFGRMRERDPLADLTEREGETLGLMAQGRSNAAIAEHLCLSPRTVESHIAVVFQKLGLEDTRDDHRRVLTVLAYLHA